MPRKKEAFALTMIIIIIMASCLVEVNGKRLIKLHLVAILEFIGESNLKWCEQEVQKIDVNFPTTGFVFITLKAPGKLLEFHNLLVV